MTGVFCLVAHLLARHDRGVSLCFQKRIEWGKEANTPVHATSQDPSVSHGLLSLGNHDGHLVCVMMRSWRLRSICTCCDQGIATYFLPRNAIEKMVLCMMFHPSVRYSSPRFEEQDEKEETGWDRKRATQDRTKNRERSRRRERCRTNRERGEF